MPRTHAPSKRTSRHGGHLRDNLPWDRVDESSWESFPASDAPSWAAPSSDDVPPTPPQRRRTAKRDRRHA